MLPPAPTTTPGPASRMDPSEPPSTASSVSGMTPSATPLDPALGSKGAAGLELDFTPRFDFLAQGREPVSLEWSDVTYTIKKKEILHQISGAAHPGEVVAIMGPSGAGKSTLLNILAGRALSDRSKGKHLTGTFRVNGREASPKSYRRQVAYVMQEDALYSTATVREALEFSAKLRLPSRVTADERRAIVDDIIDSLGLTRVQNTMLGSASVRGVSGGEKKRVAIAVELISAPSLLFLDEPTSGLDSVSAWKTVRILNALANAAGRPTCTVLCSIHQPSSEVFAEFSHLILLGQGNVIFQGAVGDLPTVMAASGFEVPQRSNPADYAMMCVQMQPIEKLPRDNGYTRAPRAAPLPRSSRGKVSGDLEQGGAASAKRSFSKRMLGVSGSSFTAAHADPEDAEPARAGIFTQMVELAKREFKGLYRDPAQLGARMATTILIGVLTALLFMHSAVQPGPGASPAVVAASVSSIFGALVVTAMTSMFGGAQPAILQIPVDKIVLLRETATGSYAIISYMAAKLLVEIPINIFFTIFQVLLVYWAFGFQGNFGELCAWLFLGVEAGISTAYVVGALADSPSAAVEFAPALLVPQFLLIGLFVPVANMPSWLQWPQYISFLKYVIDLLVITELDPSLCEPQNCASWASFMELNSIYPNLMGMYVGILFALIAGFRVIAGIVLYQKTKSYGQ